MSSPPERFDSRAFTFACAIVRLYRLMCRDSKVPLHLSRQILSAGTSIGANLSEARACQSRRDITAKFSIALKEAREIAYWLRLLVETDLLDRPTAAPLLREANELVAILTAARKRLVVDQSQGRSGPGIVRIE